MILDSEGVEKLNDFDAGHERAAKEEETPMESLFDKGDYYVGVAVVEGYAAFSCCCCCC